MIRIFDPLSTRPDPARVGRYVRDQFAGNRIPASRFDPIALKIMQYFLLPNRTSRTQNLALNNSRANDTWRLFFRLDHALGSKHRLFFTHGRQNQDQNTPGVNLAFPPEGTNGERGRKSDRPKTAVLSDTVTFRPNLLGQFRAEFFNAFNTPQFDGPTGSVTSVNFGKITSAGGARNVQLALRLTY